MIKNNKGFILVMTLVMALIMLVIAFVCLKIFLAPYIAIQNDIIKKKEFYMADTAIEVIREQISNVFYNPDVGSDGKSIRWENLSEEYTIKSLRDSYYDDKKIITFFNSEDNTINGNFIEKYSGQFLNNNYLNSSLPDKDHSVTISSTKPDKDHSATISSWPVNWWTFMDKPPLRGRVYNGDYIDKKLTVTAYIEPVKITDDIKFSTETANEGFYYKYKNGKFVEEGHETEADINNSNRFLPKELQNLNNNRFLWNSSSISADIERTIIEERIKRRDFVIVAVSTYTGSNIKCEMKYYFSLISFSFKDEDAGIFPKDFNGEWNEKGLTNDNISDDFKQLKPVYRLYFRKLEYHWTED